MRTVMSEQSGHARELARRLVAEGERQIVAVGGDGTHHEVVNGLFDALGEQELSAVRYALLPLGSGNDWIKTHRIPKKLTSWIDYYQNGVLKRQNLGLIHYTTAEGKAEKCVFTNVAGMAYDAFVVEKSVDSKLKGGLLYPLLTLIHLFAFTPPKLELVYGEGQQVVNHFHTINVGVCRYNGGGMRLVPQADPSGTKFALTYAKALSIATILANGWRFYTANIGKTPGVVCTESNTIEVKAVNNTKELVVEADGEWIGYGPLRFELLKDALSFVSVPS